MAKKKPKQKTIWELKIPTWILWAVIVSLVYTVGLFVAYDAGRRTSLLNRGAIEAREVPREKGEAINVPLFVPPERVRYQSRFHFTFDNTAILRPLRNREGLDTVVAGVKSDLEIARRLMRWVRAQWTPGRPNPYPPIDAMVILDNIRSGETGGFCAQYCFVLVQCLQSMGYKARYVTIKGHEVTEVWLPSFAKWIMLDPLYVLYVTQGTIPLSVYEIHKIVLRSGHDLKIHAQQDPGDLRAYLARYEKFAVWAKNDHVSSPINFWDIERYKIYFLDDSNERMYVPAGSLYTFFPEDVYVNPFLR